MKRSLVFLFALSALAATTAPAFAAPLEKAQAKEAYDRGLEAHKHGDVQKAAEEFARADAFAPSAVALQAALDAAIEADDAPLGAELLERAKREPAPPGLAASITAAHLKWSGRTGRLRVGCPKGSTCAAKVDDRAVVIDRIVWARTGQHTISVQVDGEAQTKLVDLGPDQVLEVMPARGGRPSVARVAPADTEPQAQPGQDDAPRARARGEGGLPPIYFYVGAGLTVVLAGVTTYFAIGTANTHSSFEKAGCGRANFGPCNELRDDGESGQTATNVALALTAVTGIATAVVGVAFTNWRGP
ncbi:MAG: hypothetical protein K0S65_5007, partial [Labilithrix sp.]|nr:hypothetical protein [Labilithrix sp.]